MATGYDNSITILRANKDANVAQGVTLKSIDSKISTQTSTSTSEATASSLQQEFQRSIQEDILLQLRILTKHWEIANDEIITERDLI